MPPAILKSQSFLIIDGMHRKPGKYKVKKGDNVGFRIAVINKISAGPIKVRLVDVKNDNVLFEQKVYMNPNETKYFDGSFTVTGNMIIEMQVWIWSSMAGGSWMLYDRYGC